MQSLDFKIDIGVQVNHKSNVNMDKYIFRYANFMKYISRPRLHQGNWIDVLGHSSCYKKYNRLGGLDTTNICFSHFWSLGSPRSSSWQIWCLVRTHFLTESPLLTVTSSGRKGLRTTRIFFYTSISLIHGGSTAMTKGFTSFYHPHEG